MVPLWGIKQTAERSGSFPRPTERTGIMLIGLGPHAKRIYFPVIDQEKNTIGAEIRVVVDLEEILRSIPH